MAGAMGAPRPRRIGGVGPAAAVREGTTELPAPASLSDHPVAPESPGGMESCAPEDGTTGIAEAMGEGVGAGVGLDACPGPGVGSGPAAGEGVAPPTVGRESAAKSAAAEARWPRAGPGVPPAGRVLRTGAASLAGSSPARALGRDTAAGRVRRSIAGGATAVVSGGRADWGRTGATRVPVGRAADTAVWTGTSAAASAPTAACAPSPVSAASAATGRVSMGSPSRPGAW